MEIGEIKWNKIKNKIGRWQRGETHAWQVTYELIEDADNPFVITQFVVDFEDGTVSTGWREELYGHQEEVQLTAEERAEAEQMIEDMEEGE